MVPATKFLTFYGGGFYDFFKARIDWPDLSYHRSTVQTCLESLGCVFHRAPTGKFMWKRLTLSLAKFCTFYGAEHNYLCSMVPATKFLKFNVGRVTD